MFTERDLRAPLSAVREAHVPDALVLDCDRDFETLDPGLAEDLGLLVDSLDPVSYPAWRGRPTTSSTSWSPRPSSKSASPCPNSSWAFSRTATPTWSPPSRTTSILPAPTSSARRCVTSTSVSTRARCSPTGTATCSTPGSTAFGDAAELACAAVKHGIEPPTPLGALATEPYREYGADYAAQWAEKTFARMD